MAIKNVGPIKELNVTISSVSEPKPIIFVGKNGSGKSIALSIIADSLIEVAKLHFMDITSAYGNGSAFFRVSGSINTTIGNSHNYAFIKFESDQGNLLYRDKDGPIDVPNEVEQLVARFGNDLGADGKGVSGTAANSDKIKTLFDGRAFCYFPPSRNERPVWITDYEYKDMTFYDLQLMNKQLDYSIVMESVWPINKSWVTSVYLDSLTDVFLDTDGGYKFKNANPVKLQFLRRSRENVEKVLSIIIGKEVYLNTEIRSMGGSRRLSAYAENGLVVPSLDALSTGQLLLFNMFVSILRAAESRNIMNSVFIENIEGIVVIDEIDSHMHTDFQYQVLPELVALFPKVQFFISTHSPLFVLGMERKFKSDGIILIDVTTGEPITSERFSEFKASYDYYKDTVTYEQDVLEEIKRISKPTAFFEGKTDVMYVNEALKVFGRDDLISRISIDKAGKDEGGKSSGGDSMLAKFQAVLELKPDLLSRQVALIYDPEVKKANIDIGNLKVRVLPLHDSPKCSKGIENLLPPVYFELGSSEFAERFGVPRETFWLSREISQPYGAITTVQEFQKVAFAEWFCRTQATKDNFANFQSIVSILEEIV